MREIMRHIIFLILAFAAALSLSAQDLEASKETADSAYAKQDYVGATRIYEKQVVKDVDPEVFYNLGNAYYRQQNYPAAILNYERALKYEPSHDDAAYNLSVVRSKANVPTLQSSEMFFVTWINSFVRSHSADDFGVSALIFFALSLLIFAIYRCANLLLFRKICFSLSVASLSVVFVCITCAALQSNRFHNERKAVVMTDAQLRPDGEKAKTQTLPAGTTVVIADESTDGTFMVETPDQACRGWVHGRHLAEF